MFRLFPAAPAARPGVADFSHVTDPAFTCATQVIGTMRSALLLSGSALTTDGPRMLLRSEQAEIAVSAMRASTKVDPCGNVRLISFSIGVGEGWAARESPRRPALPFESQGARAHMARAIT